ncbi:MAG: hypothetical protein HOH73_01955 [Alphaproteobacteria bacterium]|jgi:hypothetical protein|nr:hypothetical protein [Alphaproteobacteria bacterium]
MNKTRCYLVLALINFIAYSQASADNYPNLEGDYWLKLQLNKDISYKDSDNSTIDNSMKYSNYFLEYSPEFKLNLTNRSSFINKWSFLNLKSPNEDKQNIFFEDEGLVLNKLYYKFEQDDLFFLIGKFEPNYALGHDEKLNSAIWGSDYADEYRLQNKLGVGLSAKINLDNYGKHLISINSFYNDDTDLSESTITRRDLTLGDAGKAGNTDSLSSYTLSLSGKDIYNIPEFFYNISYRNIDAGNTLANISDESGYSFSIGNKNNFSSLNIFTFAEYSNIQNFNSTNDRFGPEFSDNIVAANYEYLTLITSFKYQNWSLNLNRLTKDVDVTGLSNANQNELSVGYDINDNLVLTLGRKYEKDSSNVRKSSFGLMLYSSKDF